VLVLPWYGIGEESTAGVASALVQGLSGYIWLLGLLLPPCLAAVAAGCRQPRLLVWIGLAGIAWLGLEAFAIGGHGWRFGWLAGLAGGAPAQPALGWGATVYALSMLVLVAYGLAWQGWCKGDVFIVASIAIVCGSILVFVFYPVACILLSAFQDNAGHFDLGLFLHKVTDRSIWGLGCVTGGRNCGVAWNSLAEAILFGWAPRRERTRRARAESSLSREPYGI
jgi:iron(III) transport system permease protein